VVLGSGSSGNASVVTDGTTTVLVDCGFSAREVARRLGDAGIDPRSVQAVFVTHEHGDHVRGLDVFCRRYAPACEVHASAGTRHAAGLTALERTAKPLRIGETMRVGSLTVLTFPASHDAVEPVGFRIDAEGGSIGMVTDTGVITPEAREALAGCTTIALECNHDLRMLEQGPYPAYLKRRIRSVHGHLSNADAADSLETLAHDGLEHVIALHRSRTNNTRELVSELITERLRRIGLRSSVQVAAQDLACDTDPGQQRLFGERD
jgi:phosphoribosyl 1,2-cyclic phosphodiesterase